MHTFVVKLSLPICFLPDSLVLMGGGVNILKLYSAEHVLTKVLMCAVEATHSLGVMLDTLKSESPCERDVTNWVIHP